MIGNKIDAIDERVITKTQGEKRACELGILHKEAAYENVENIQEIFSSFVKQIYCNIVIAKYKSI